jgi:RNA polymerase sigma factor (sigma-70 family)
LAHPKKDWILTRDAFDKLLASLDADRESAAEKYEDLRRTLVTYFEFRDVPAPEELVDETLDRVARRLSEGQEVYASNPASYFYAVARNVWREYLAGPNKTVSSLDALPASRAGAEDPLETRERDAERAERERRLTCLERCLSAMPADVRDVITDYYQGEKDVKIRGRKAIAERLGIPLNALRIRACRQRARLEECVRACLQENEA